MSSIWPRHSQLGRDDSGRYREILFIIILTLAGALVRIWSLGRLGLVHFDEGIYTLAGLWPLLPRGLQSLDPTYIAYAPPGFPILVGLAYLLIGINDTSAILVSILTGTATIPVCAWLSLRTFGRGAGAVVAAVAAGSAAHVSFSRMALTDASFLLIFLIAVGQGQRFLERPNATRAILLGLSVGAAQLFKYNGWISGMIVVVALALRQTVNRNKETSRAVLTAWSWGLLAILLAAIMYWPWFQFVENHGGYRLLLAHQRGYMNGISRWWDHLHMQLSQARALGGSLRWRISVGIAAGLVNLISAGDFPRFQRRGPRRIIEALGLASLCAVSNVEWWAPLGWIVCIATCGIQSASPTMLVLGVGWLTLSIMTPFYHPYARLWLPVHALGWIIIGGLFTAVRSWLESADRSTTNQQKRRFNPLLGFALICVVALANMITSALRSGKEHFPNALEPTDSLRIACRAVPRSLPATVSDLRLFSRPAVTFYASFDNHVNLRIQPSLERLLEPSGQSTWCLLDTALAPQERGSSGEGSALSPNWVTARSFSTYLNLPTALDIDPTSCYQGSIDSSAPLLLLRPARPEGNR
jgi:4-amino-4-deoxy-L-arabinose transferase-like glycosyltransferase